MKLAIRQERLSKGWTQDYVAEKIGIAKSTVQMLETGRRKPSFDVLVKLLDLFNCNDPRILFGAATPEEEGEKYDRRKT